MTKETALYNFWSSFGLPAYEENSVYTMQTSPTFPYITYEIQTDNFEGNTVFLSASLWYRSTSWVEINAKSQEIAESIGIGGKQINNVESGSMWIKRNSPFSQNSADPSDDVIKRKIINIAVDFFTAI